MALLIWGFPPSFLQSQHRLLKLQPGVTHANLSSSVVQIPVYKFSKIPLKTLISSATTQQQQSSSSTIALESTLSEGKDSIEEPRTRLIVQNIPWTCTSEDIRKLFENHGTVMDVELSMYNRTTNRGLAFLSMASEEEALTALNNLNSHELGGRIIKVQYATSLRRKSYPDMKKLESKYNVFVGNLSWKVRSHHLRDLFSARDCKFLSVEVIFQSNPRRSAGYGFVSFSSKEEAEAAIASFNGKKLMGRSIRLILNEKSNKNDGESMESDRGSTEI